MLHSLDDAKRLGVRFGCLPDDLRLDDIDPSMRAIVARINASGWLWTTMCCDGTHNDAKPYIGLACRSEEAGRLFRLLLASLRQPCPYPRHNQTGCDGCCGSGEHAIRFEVWANPWVDAAWTDVFLTCADANEESAMLRGLNRLAQHVAAPD